MRLNYDWRVLFGFSKARNLFNRSAVDFKRERKGQGDVAC